jgi:hypothetical protein
VTDLRLDWCSYEAAKYAVEHWHYSRSMPAGKTSRLGVWEDGRYIGCVVFARGSNKWLGLPFGLSQTACVELVRVALSVHGTPTSRVVAVACRMLKQQSPGIRLLISFADMSQGHVGTLYQAAGWVYTGPGTEDVRSRPYRARDGSIQHWRTVAGVLASRGRPSTIAAAEAIGFVPLDKKPKHRYLMPLDAAMREQIRSLAKPYPRRPRLESEAPAHQAGDEGAAMRPVGSNSGRKAVRDGAAV